MIALLTFVFHWQNDVVDLMWQIRYGTYVHFSPSRQSTIPSQSPTPTTTSNSHAVLPLNRPTIPLPSLTTRPSPLDLAPSPHAPDTPPTILLPPILRSLQNIPAPRIARARQLNSQQLQRAEARQPAEGLHVGEVAVSPI